MKTNYILAAAWGLLYVLTAVWTFLLRRAGFGNLLIIVNNLVPILMGFFTMWFEKWYPAKMAREKKKALYRKNIIKKKATGWAGSSLWRGAPPPGIL